MVSIARKNLFQDKGRFLISIGGVAFAVLLILILQSLYQGWNEKITVYIDSVDTDLWVVQKGTQDMFHTLSVMPENIEEGIKQIEGIKEINKLIGRAVMNEITGEKQLMMLMGFNTETGIAGPAKIIKGNSKPADGEIIIDKVFAKNNDFEIGDEIEIAGHKEKIVGISEGGDMAMAQVAYVNTDEAKRIFGFEEVVNYFLVKVEDRKDIVNIKEKIESKIENVDALEVSTFAKNNKKIILDSFLPILFVLVIIGFIIGVVVIGLTIYTLTVEKTREFGILKAIGSDNLKLYMIVFKQSLISGLIGFATGVSLTFLVSYLAEFYVPEFVTTFRVIDIIWVLGATIIMGLIASYIPIKKISKIDPAIVFKS
jgi:putative ABC transport system permease protein